MSRLRAVAAHVLEHGRLLGTIERDKRTLRELEAILLKSRLPDGPPLEELIGGLQKFLDSEVRFWEPVLPERNAQVEHVVAALEHPGARLAGRLVAAARAARAAWRAAR